MTASEKWQSHIVHQEQSGLTQAEYCRQQKLHPVSFSQWKRRLKDDAHETGFVALNLPAVSEHSFPNDTFRVFLASGLELVFPTTIDHNRLVLILSVLREL